MEMSPFEPIMCDCLQLIKRCNVSCRLSVLDGVKTMMHASDMDTCCFSTSCTPTVYSAVASM